MCSRLWQWLANQRAKWDDEGDGDDEEGEEDEEDWG